MLGIIIIESYSCQIDEIVADLPNLCETWKSKTIISALNGAFQKQLCLTK